MLSGGFVPITEAFPFSKEETAALGTSSTVTIGVCFSLP
jgi:hypothetical protein